MSIKFNSSIPTPPPIAQRPVLIREATDADRRALVELAQRDSTTLPPGPLMVAENEGELRAAIAIDTGRTIADPFRRTADLVALLRARADQLRGSRGRKLRVVARTATADAPRRSLRQAA